MGTHYIKLSVICAHTKLVAGLVVSNLLKTGLDWIFGLELVIFVVAGAIALIAKAIR
ncbi:hypothetical protein HYY72_02930 [Candidatus Woesearchaeota archaeon]|nr:hypothetical protein [Candidatus Woesearchaeota archaeon]